MITSSICLACHGTPNSGVHWHTSIHTNSNWHPILVLHTTCYVIHTRHTPFHTNNNWSHHMLYCSHATHLHSQHQIHFTPNINASHHMLGHSHTIHTLSHQQQLVTPHAILFTHDTPSFTPNTLHTQYQCFTPHVMSLTPNTYPFTPRRGTKHVVITPSTYVHTMLVWFTVFWCELHIIWYETRSFGCEYHRWMQKCWTNVWSSLVRERAMDGSKFFHTPIRKKHVKWSHHTVWSLNFQQMDVWSHQKCLDHTI